MSREQLSKEQEIQSAYSDQKVSANYITNRFETELTRLLHDQQVEEVNRIMAQAQPERTLEIAPGPGRVTRDIKPYGTLTCLEYNPNMIEEGEKNCSYDISWIQGNAFDFSFEEPFDFIYSFRFIRHFQYEDRIRLYLQIKNALKTNGVLVFDAVNIKQSEPFRNRNPEAYPIYDKLFRRAELLEELKENGFMGTQLLPVQKFYRMQYLSQVFLGPRSDFLNKLMVRGLEQLPRKDGLEWIVTCRLA